MADQAAEKSATAVQDTKPAAPAQASKAEEKPRTRRGRALDLLHLRLFDAWCKAGCGICVAYCPTGVLALDDVTGKCKIVNLAACNKCGICELRCPDFAITLEEITHVEVEAENDGVPG